MKRTALISLLVLLFTINNVAAQPAAKNPAKDPVKDPAGLAEAAGMGEIGRAHV